MSNLTYCQQGARVRPNLRVQRTRVARCARPGSPLTRHPLGGEVMWRRSFRFKKGQRVVTVRGTVRIRQGYDSGEMIGYEIDGDDGSLFAAEESDLRLATDG